MLAKFSFPSAILTLHVAIIFQDPILAVYAKQKQQITAVDWKFSTYLMQTTQCAFVSAIGSWAMRTTVMKLLQVTQRV